MSKSFPFRGVVALSCVSFAVRPGQIVGLIGPNGAGKSTTFRLLAGLTKPTSGDVQVMGCSMPAGRDIVMGRMGVTVDSPGLYPHLSVRANVSAFAAAGGRSLQRQEVTALLDRVGLAGTGRRRVGQLSTGMRQRLALAMALMGHPRLLVLDEPAAGLDPMGVADIRRILQGQAAAGVGVLISSHMMSEVARLCDRVVLLHLGRVHFIGAPDDLIAAATTVETTPADPGVLTGVLRLHARSIRRRDGSVIVTGLSLAHVRELAARAGVGNLGAVAERRPGLDDALVTLIETASDDSGGRVDDQLNGGTADGTGCEMDEGRP